MATIHRSDSNTSVNTEPEIPLDDTRIVNYDPLLPPQILFMEYPLSITSRHTVARARRRANRILKEEDDRILVIVGPCSIHDTEEAWEYGKKLLK